MELKILKFGGTSVANISRLEHVANIVKKQFNRGDKIVVVVSAMAGITDQLVTYAKSMDITKVSDEHDLVYSAGEQVTAGLMALALKKNDLNAKSFLSWQIPIITDSVPTAAKILNLESSQLVNCIENGVIPVIAGFQGVSKSNRITTLGRGGSDATAVAIAIALNADSCDIYTDVDGVYTADPNLVPKAKPLSQITYEEMFEMATSGAKVLQARSVEMAMKHKVKLRVLSSFQDYSVGTIVVEERENMEEILVSGIAHSQNEAKITLIGVYNKPGMASIIFSEIVKERIMVDMVVHSHSIEGRTDISFTCNRIDIDRLIIILENSKKTLGFNEIIIDKNIAKIALVGVGLKSNLEIPAKLFKVLADNDVNIQMITSSEIKISVIIPQSALQKSLIAIHDAFELDKIAEEAA
jgi:aspartate kinase